MSTRYRYLLWDGAQQEFSLEASELFREFSDFLMEGWTPEEALDWIIKQGVNFQDLRIMGLDELRSEISKLRDSLYKTYDFNSALDEIREELEEIKDMELDTVSLQLPTSSDDYQKREDILNNLPEQLSSAIEALSGYDFMNEEAADRLRELLDKIEDIKKLEKFLARFNNRISGNEKISFDEALEIIQDLESLDEFEQNLISGNFEEISLETLKKLLEEDAYNSFLLLRDFKSELESSGYIRTQNNSTDLTPKGIRKIGEIALRDVFSSLIRHRFGSHETAQRGVGSLKMEKTKAYEFGDPFNLNVVNTLRNSLLRGTKGKQINLSPDDFEVYDSEFHTQSTTALLLDLSWSMSFQGRFPAAKRVALALDHLIRSRHPKDNFYIIGFSTRAKTLTAKQLALTSWDSNDPFTNIQEALHLATRLVSKHKSPNKQIILITDGQPTAYYVDGYLQVELPMFFGGLSPRATFETLREVKRCTRQGIRINTFMLDDSPPLRRFVDEMTRINKGRAFFTSPSQLGKYLLVDYFSRRKKII
ncbi:MAG: VWA domain-containing protein [Thermodesulfobacteriota bacterium]